MKKKLNAIIALLLSVACLPVAPLNANAIVQSNDWYDVSSEGIVYSLGRDIVEEDMLPPLGETMIESYFLQSAMNENPSAKFAVEIHAYVMKDYKEEEKQFQAEHYMDGKSYAEILDTLNEKNESQYTKEEEELAWQIWGETHAYTHTLYEKQQSYEPEWLKKQGINIVKSEVTGMFNYAIVTREQLENFPVSETSGYKIFLAPLSAVDETACVNSQKISKELKEYIGLGETKITVAVWYKSNSEDYTTAGENIISEMEIPEESVKYICIMFDNPAVICGLSPKQIVQLSNRDDVLKLNYHNDLDSAEVVINPTEPTEDTRETLIPYVYNENDEFADDRVVVSLKKDFSKLNYEWNPSDFNFENISEIKDLTHMEMSPEQQETYLQQVNFHQILCVYLKEKGTEQVLDAVKALEQNEMVLSVSPDTMVVNYAMEGDTSTGLDEENILNGDIDGSGQVNIVDVLALNQYLLGVYQPSDYGILAGDVNHNGTIDDGDALTILKSIVGLVELV